MGSLSPNSFKTVHVLLKVWIPYDASILKCGTHQSDVSKFLTVKWTSFQVTTEKTEFTLYYNSLLHSDMVHLKY